MAANCGVAELQAEVQRLTAAKGERRWVRDQLASKERGLAASLEALRARVAVRGGRGAGSCRNCNE